MYISIGKNTKIETCVSVKKTQLNKINILLKKTLIYYMQANRCRKCFYLPHLFPSEARELEKLLSKNKNLFLYSL